MQISQERRYAPDLVVRAEFPSLSVTVPLAQVSIRRADRELSSASFKIYRSFTDREWHAKVQMGLPVRVFWNVYGQEAEFCGYIFTCDTDSPDVLDVVMIGVGFPLLRPHGRAYAGGSASQAVRDICTSNLLGYSTSRQHVTTFNATQGGDTDWEWLKKITRKRAWSCHFRGTTFVAHDLNHLRDYGRKPPYEVVIPDQGVFTPTTDTASPVRSFVTRKKNSSKGTLESKMSYSRVTLDGHVLSAQSDNPRHPDAGAGFSVDSVSSALDAEQQTSPHAADTRYEYEAVLIMDLDSSIHPLDLVRLWDYRRVMTGIWSVLSIKITLGGHDAIMELLLGKEKLTDRLFSLGKGVLSTEYPRVFRSVGNPTMYSEPTLRNSPSSSKIGEYIWAPKVVRM